MSSILVAKRLSLFSSPASFHLLTPLLLRLTFSTQPSDQNQKETPFVAKYLVSSFGFSPDRALKVSRRSSLARIKSSDRPDSVLRFFNDMGFSESQIKAVVSFQPELLGYSVEKTLKPKARELMEAGFSQELLIQLIRHNPYALCRKDTLSYLLFWRHFVGNSDEALLNIIQRKTLLISHDIDNYVIPLINLLNEYELSNQDILSLICSGSRLIGCNLGSLTQTIEFIEEMGVRRGSKKFLYAVKLVACVRKDKIQRNVELFMSTYRWSQEEVYAAFRKNPQVLALSEEKVKSNMNFLTRKAGFETTKIASQAWLLGYSVEKVLMPRHAVLSALDAEGLKRKKCSFPSACLMSKRHFYEKYVVPFEKDIPGLTEAYVAAGGEKMQA